MSDEHIPAGDRAVGAYLDTLASEAPTPGGGSVTALVAAMAAALGEMVANLTLGRPAYADAFDLLAGARLRLSGARERLLALAGDDELAYAAFLRASQLPKGTREERQARTEAMQRALAHAADVPLQVAATCLAVLAEIETVAGAGNRHVLSDAIIGALLAETAVRAAAVNVEVNARLLHDTEQGAALLARARAMESQAATLATRARQTATSRTGSA